jgi:hypothetical protein
MDLKYILLNKIEFCEGKTEKIKRKRHQPDLNRHHLIQSRGIVLNHWAKYKLMIS